METAQQRDRGAIRTPDQRLRVFVSSTLAELADERVAVARAIEALRLTPVLFELGARPHPPRELYRAYLSQCDIFVGLYWQRYGWVAPDMEISGLEDEFELSRSMPRLLYIKTPAPDRESRLIEMLDGLQSEATESYRSFKSARELGRLVRDDLAVLLSERFAAGEDKERAAIATDSTGDRGRRPRSLPVQSTSLVGRDHDLAQVAALIQQPDVRLVTLTGPGGIGKTRLAVAVGERLDDRYPLGTIFVPLASTTEPELVIPRIAAAVGAFTEAAQSPLAVLVEHLGDTRILLVLDNLEQVVAVAPELDELLRRCPGVEILATSRTVLRLRAEREYPVAPLAVPAFNRRPSITELAALPAVELFVDRARTVRPDFAITEENAEAVTEICRRLDGLPLAIELAAARIRLLEPTDLLARLGNRLDVLGTGPVDLPERQRTLRATVEWSVGLLDSSERDMLAALSVFVDGWTLDAAARVTHLADDLALDLLDGLARHSLLQVTPAKSGLRFSMLESVRELATEHLAASPRSDDIERQHALHFRHVVEGLEGPASTQTEWTERLQPEEGNVRAAVRWLLAHDIAPLPHLFRTLWPYWQQRDHMAEARTWIEELLPSADTLDDPTQAELQLVAAMTAVEVGDDDGALAAASAIDQLQGRSGDPLLESAMQMARSWVLPISGDLERALDAASTALDGFRQYDNDLFGLATSLLTVGTLEMATGRAEAGREHLVEAAALADLGAPFASDLITYGPRVQLASYAVTAGHFDEARALLDESLAADRDSDLSTHTVAFCLIATARLALAEGALKRAALTLGAADGLRRRAGLRVWPSVRPGEAELHARVRAALDPAAFEEAFATGNDLTRQDAVAFMRQLATTESQ
jgi:predicted ATPase